MEILDRYLAYAAAFEEAYASDDWSILEPYFTNDAVYEFVAPSSRSGTFTGRSAVLAMFEKSVNDVDRRFDSRTIEFLEGPCERDGVIWTRWLCTFTLAGAPNCLMEGEERAEFSGERICRLVDSINEEQLASRKAYFAQYGDRLKPKP